MRKWSGGWGVGKCDARCEKEDTLKRELRAGVVGLLAVVVAIWLGACALNKEPESPMAEMRLRAAMPGTGSAIGRGSGGAGEELWIVPVSGMRSGGAGGRRGSIVAAADMGGRGSGMAVPGSGVLAVRTGNGFAEMPLKHTDVTATISGMIASVGVKQTFVNTSEVPIQAVYVFPLPADAGVREFVMTIGERHIRGIVRERAEAEQIYAAARAQGYVASLLAEERPNVFTQSVAHIAPGQGIEVEMTYFHTLTYVDGWCEWVYPMVVGGRLDGGGGAMARVPAERSGRDISVSVELDAGVAIEELGSVNQKVAERQVTRALSASQRVVDLVPAERIANKDFVLRWKVAGEGVKSGMVVQRDGDGKGGWFSLMIVPPTVAAPPEGKGLARRAVDAVFVVDTSMAMDGGTLVRARNALSAALMRLHAEDTFEIVTCGGGNGVFSEKPVAATGENVARGQQYASTLQAGGGASLVGIRAALGRPRDAGRGRVVGLFTSGNAASDLDVARALQDRLADAWVISFGPRSAASRGLLEALARVGHDQAAYLALEDLVGTDLDACFERVSHPVLTGVKVDFGGMKVSEMYPEKVGELFAGRAVVVTGRFSGVPGAVTVSGMEGGNVRAWTVEAKGEMNPAVAAVRAKLTDLHDQAMFGERDIRGEATATALTYGLASEFTSFVAVDATGRDGREDVTVPVTAGVEWEVVRGRRE